ncbi:hypothetical protein JL721_440 [Aureococcus anophagefferens]|nr:hypothetical protein JL721_440 [Aureococcus anophagefferens]
MVRLALLAALAAAETFDFVHEHWTEIVAPANGERFGAGAALAVVAELRSASLPAVRNATVVSLPLRVATSERLYSFGVGEAPADAAAPGRVAAFCAAVGLEPANCAKVARRREPRGARRRAGAGARVCVALQRGGDAARRSAPTAAARRFAVAAAPARRGVGGRGRGRRRGARGPPGGQGRRALRVPAAPRAPRRRAWRRGPAPSSADAIAVAVDGDGPVCVALDGGAPRCGAAPLVLAALAGRHRVAAWRPARRARRGAVRRPRRLRGARELGLRAAVAAAIAARPRLITAVSERYVAEGILGNLVGSLHFWEPGEVLDVYDLGLSPAARADVAAMADVRLLPLAPAAARALSARYGVAVAERDVPPHLLNASTYAFKAAVVADALAAHGATLWIDANAELRRPLDEVRCLVAERGHFLVEHPCRFPTAQFHHPAALARLGCAAPDFSREHCATTFIGAARRGWLARDVLPRLVDCVADPDCVNPPGSSRANHRQEQTALNAILCARDYDPDGACHGDKRLRMTSDFENDADPVQPTADETDWNDVVFYTRRNHALKPYRRFLRRRARGE